MTPHRTEDILANADVADLALVNHLFELLPRGVRVGGEVKVELVSCTLLDGNWPGKPLNNYAESRTRVRENEPMNEV